MLGDAQLVKQAHLRRAPVELVLRHGTGLRTLALAVRTRSDGEADGVGELGDGRIVLVLERRVDEHACAVGEELGHAARARRDNAQTHGHGLGEHDRRLVRGREAQEDVGRGEVRLWVLDVAGKDSDVLGQVALGDLAVERVERDRVVAAADVARDEDDEEARVALRLERRDELGHELRAVQGGQGRRDEDDGRLVEDLEELALGERADFARDGEEGLRVDARGEDANGRRGVATRDELGRDVLRRGERAGGEALRNGRQEEGPRRLARTVDVEVLENEETGVSSARGRPRDVGETRERRTSTKRTSGRCSARAGRSSYSSSDSAKTTS